MVPSRRVGAIVQVSEIGPYATPPLATVRLTLSWSALPAAVLVAISHTSSGMGIRTKFPPVMPRMAGRPNVPDQVNDPVVVARSIRIASASPGAPGPPGGAQVHIRSGARIPRGHTVWSYG